MTQKIKILDRRDSLDQCDNLSLISIVKTLEKSILLLLIVRNPRKLIVKGKGNLILCSNQIYENRPSKMKFFSC